MAKFIEIEAFSDSRGTLAVIQNSIEFVIKRVYYIVGANNVRGGHRHIKTRQIALCVSGSCMIRVFDRIENIEKEFLLDSPYRGLLLDPDDFHWMDNFSKDSVLLVLANEEFDKNDYLYEK